MSKVFYMFRALKKVFVISKADSYYPDKDRKCYFQRLCENFGYLLKYKSVNDFYLLYGFDIKGTDKSDFIDYNVFKRTRERENKLNSYMRQIVLVRDKFLFYKFMKSNNIPVPDVFGVVKNGKLYDTDWNEQPLSYIDNKNNFFLKDAAGECASFVKHCHGRRDFEKWLPSLSQNGIYILQDTLKQHPVMNELNPYSVNTIRIVTINKGEKPYVLTALLRVGTKKSGSVDNWAAGGLAIGCTDDGYLKEYGFYKPIHGTKTNTHPDTNIKFSNFKIPMYEQVVKLVVEAHKHLYNMHSIGWDVAISENGPVLIEGNDNWEISLMQAADRSLKSDWENAIS